VRYEMQMVNGLALMNDLERPVFEKLLFLAELKSWLREQFEVRAALMSGSGATVFGRWPGPFPPMPRRRR
jgi:4-diphosphocytidyl-2-C-methyl-D-erythritol kinase